MRRLAIVWLLLRPLLIAVLLAGIVVGAVAARGFRSQHSDAPALRHMLSALPHGRYDPAGRYPGPDTAGISSLISASWEITLGADGVPRIKYPGIGYQANPVTAAQYGLRAYGRWLHTRRRSERVIVLRVADWLVRRQASDGLWLYKFDFSFSGGHMVAPWPSAMAQGQAMSLLERAYGLTGRRRYLQAAIRALEPLAARPGSSRLVDCFESCRHPFFEEYPTRPASDVLNGFMFTLVGLYDLASIAPHSSAQRLYREGLATLRVALPRYDANGVARYCLSSTEVAPQSYQAIHVYLLRTLDSVAPDPRFVFYGRRWLGNLGRAPVA
jgi:heparosan-N-sulfate-glucuronate 5-epimerase